MNKRSGINSKKRILGAAVKVFSAYGYSGANIRMIAKAADISIGGLYLYFKNKEELYLTLMKKRLDDASDRMMAAIRDIEDPATALSTFIRVYISHVKKRRSLIVVHGREHGLKFGLDIKRKFFMKQRGIIEDIIRLGVKSGTFRAVDAKETARIIFSVLRGFVISMMIEPDALFSHKDCSNLILNGLMRRDKNE